MPEWAIILLQVVTYAGVGYAIYFHKNTIKDQKKTIRILRNDYATLQMRYLIFQQKALDEVERLRNVIENEPEDSTIMQFTLPEE